MVQWADVQTKKNSLKKVNTELENILHQNVFGVVNVNIAACPSRYGQADLF